jgi:hypothetical protein
VSNELLKDIAELRRNMPRNSMVLRVCQALEAALIDAARREMIKGIINGVPEQIEKATSITKSFDKTAYQRDYMRKRRAEKQSAGTQG